MVSAFSTALGMAIGAYLAGANMHYIVMLFLNVLIGIGLYELNKKYFCS